MGASYFGYRFADRRARRQAVGIVQIALGLSSRPKKDEYFSL